MSRKKSQLSGLLLGMTQVALLVVVCVVYLVIRLVPAPPLPHLSYDHTLDDFGHAQPMTLLQVRHFLLELLPQFYLLNASQLTVPPVLRHASYRNQSTCQVNFLTEEGDACSSLVHKDDESSLLRSSLVNVPDPFKNWNTNVCGPEPFDPSRYHYSTGQGYFPSQECMLCSHNPGGHLLQLPLPLTPIRIFTNRCVLPPLRQWLDHHVSSRSRFLLSDTILVNKHTDEIQRFQYGFEDLASGLWWPYTVTTPLRPQTPLWILAACCSALMGVLLFINITLQYTSVRQAESFGLRAIQGILVAFWLVLCYKYSSGDAHWSQMMANLTRKYQNKEESDDDKHREVLSGYQAHTTYQDYLWSIDTLLAITLSLMTVNILWCRSFLEGWCRGIRLLVLPTVLMASWVAVVAVVGVATIGDQHPGMENLAVALKTLITWNLRLAHLQNTPATMVFVAMLFLTVYLAVPVWLGVLLAQIQVLWEGRWGISRRRWINNDKGEPQDDSPNTWWKQLYV